MRAAVDRDPQSELGAEKQQLRIDGVFLDDVRVAAYPLESCELTSGLQDFPKSVVA